MRKWSWAVRAVSVLIIAPLVAWSLLPASVLAASGGKKASHHVFVLLPGITSELSSLDIFLEDTPGFANVKSAISQAVPDAEFVTYSYNGPTQKGKVKYTPKTYSCFDTTQNTIPDDVTALDNQIQAIVKSEPQASIYLVGHSLGGVIAYSYLGALKETNIVKPLPNNNLAGVITLDSPIGGVSDNATYQQAAIDYFAAACRQPIFASSPLLNLGTIYQSLPSRNLQPRGGHASVLSLPFPDISSIPFPYPTNQEIARDAVNGDAVTGVLTIGNWNDLLWNPITCGLDVTQFVATQWVGDRGDNSGVYGRTITQGDPFNCFLSLTLTGANHLFTLSDPDVMQAIQQFITGQTPSALPPAHGES